MGLSLESSLKNKDKTSSLPWNHIAQVYVHKGPHEQFDHWRQHQRKSNLPAGCNIDLIVFDMKLLHFISHIFSSSITHLRGEVNNCQWTVATCDKSIKQWCTPHLATQTKRFLSLEEGWQYSCHMSPENITFTINIFDVR